jgi:pyruvate/2-oxoacid:ferredoxin oxidoreductase beta subunit
LIELTSSRDPLLIAMALFAIYVAQITYIAYKTKKKAR